MLLYLAIDGVAPKAKLNQQRARRFRIAKDNELAEETENKLREEFLSKGKRILPKLHSEVTDSNVITPGTEFMQELSNALKCYISERRKNNPAWRNIKVILSDASVPGEGEHKIISFIRSLRTIPGYDPNTRHCLYGLDADLIMLALSTHELHFSIIREDVLTVHEQKPVSESALLSSIKKAEDLTFSKSSNEKKPFFDIRYEKSSMLNNQHYQFLHVWILREYLEVDMKIVDLPDNFVFDIERIIDDFIFICFFAGNDFLPHMPTLEIRENGIDLLLHVYKNELKNLGGYLVDMQRVNDKHAGYVKLKRVERFILSVGSYEEKIFKKRTELKERKLRRILSELSESKDDELDDVSEADIADVETQQTTSAIDSAEFHELVNSVEKLPIADQEEMLANTKELKEKLKVCIREKSDIFKNGLMGSDKVKLGTVGWKQRYYREKFSVEDPKEVELLRKQIVKKYTEGLCWVLLYYFSGMPSWNWYYPYHYGPFASDLKGLSQVKVKFQKGSAFRPFDQLMAVLPPRSAHALPKPYRELMLDRSSDIVDFYPNDVEIDVDGKRYYWEGICKLPFIKQEALLDATKLLEEKIEEMEAKRNVETNDQLFMRGSSVEGIWSCLWHYRVNEETNQPAAGESATLSFCYKLPVTSSNPPGLLNGVQPPEKVILFKDINHLMHTPLWHEYSGNRPMPRSSAQNWHGSSTNYMDQMSPYEHPGRGRGFNSTGRGKQINANSYDSDYQQTKQRHQYPCNQEGSAHNSFRPVSYRAAVSSSNAAGRSHYFPNGFWPSRSQTSNSDSHDWRSSFDVRTCDGNYPRFMERGRGRGRGHFRPSAN